MRKDATQKSGGKCWGRRDGQCKGPESGVCCKGPESGVCSLWFLTLERLANSLFSKVSIHFTSCKIFSYNKNFKFTVCLSIVIFYRVTFMPSLRDVFLQDTRSSPQPHIPILKNNFSNFRSHRYLLQNTWKAHSKNPNTEQIKLKQNKSHLLFCHSELTSAI